jgi:hypothetical protein
MSEDTKVKEERLLKLQAENQALRAQVDKNLDDVEEMKLLMEQAKRLEEMNALLRRDRDIMLTLAAKLPEGRLAGQTVLITEKPTPPAQEPPK